MRFIPWSWAGILVWACWTHFAPASDLRYFEDATLRAVQFLDEKEGWAVGDEGLILHTIDGGKNWIRKPTDSRASLRSVYFNSGLPLKNIGWIVGREELSHGRSVGVALFTRDGGAKWLRQLDNTLPGLNQVRFTDLRTGFLLGDASDQFPSGLFKTWDGGRSWEPVPESNRGQGHVTSWLAGDFQDGKNGVLVGAWSQLALLRDNVFGRTKEVDSFGGRSVYALQIMDKKILAVAEGGLILFSTTGGKSWGFLNLKLPDDIQRSLDFFAIHAVNSRAWVVGKPGSMVLTTPDKGTTWKLLKTGQNCTLHGVFFIDERTGWAVGDLGTILATKDGGETWTVQRQGGKRAAVLCVHATPPSSHPKRGGLPLDTVGLLGGEEGYLTAALRVVGPDPVSAPFQNCSDSQRFAASVRQAGGVTGETLWPFPLPEHFSGLDQNRCLEQWNRLHDQQANWELMRQLVLSIRIWRPSAVLIDHPDAKVTGNAVGSLIAEALSKALQLAGDKEAFPEQIEKLGLEPWRPTRLFALSPSQNSQTIAIDNYEIRPRLGNSLCDFAKPALDLWGENGIIPGQRFYLFHDFTNEGKLLPKHLMDGLNLAPGCEARRALPLEGRASAEQLKNARERRNLAVLADNMKDPSKTLAQIVPLLEKMPADQGAQAALTLAQIYVRRGQWELAREAYLLMVQRYGAHPSALEAFRWLVQHNSSSEARRRHDLKQFSMVSQLAFEKIKPPMKDGHGEGIQQTNLFQPVASGEMTFWKNEGEIRQWYLSSLELGKRLKLFGPLFEQDPAIQFCLESARRRLGSAEFAQAQKNYSHFLSQFPPGPWRDAAGAEIWLTNRQTSAPKSIGLCRYAASRPFLEGDFQDPCWQEHQPLILNQVVAMSERNPGEPKEKNAQHFLKRFPTRAWMAYDEEYLYMALECRHPQGESVKAVEKRPRDADLESFDRVSILLDLDRDYATCFHLQVDQRGCVREDCWGDLGWDPRWFVALRSTPDGWFIEAAIPMVELTSDRVVPGAAWACNVVRIIPGHGVQAWSIPAGVQPRPEGMGLLLFQGKPASPPHPNAAPQMPGAK